MRADLSGIAQHFLFEGDYLRAERLRSGHINDTYALFFRQADGSVRRYLLQRINHHVFTSPEKLMQNIQGITAHLRQKIVAAGGDPARETLNLIPTVEGRAFCQTSDGNYWRAAIFIEGAQTYEIAENLEHVYNVAHAFGRFQRLASDYPVERLHETIRDFHHTPKRFAAFVEAVERDAINRARSARAEIEFVERRVGDMPILVDLLRQGKLPQRVTHNDTKFNNVMIDDSTGKGICVIDLDTVMPGLSLYDFGDAVRSGANPAAEDEQDLSKVTLDLEIFDRLAGGYLNAARDLLTPLEIDYLAFSARIMTLECGMRFLTDYLNGDLYFRILRENHNLDRCRTQFKMVRTMEEQFDAMVSIVTRQRPHASRRPS